MPGPSRILCVVDPTSRTQNAVSRAQWLASNTGAELELLICDYNEYLSGERFSDAPSLQRARSNILRLHKAYLDDMAQPLRAAGLTVNTRVAWTFPLYEGIVQQALESNATFVFKDTHHHAAIDRTVFGNTDWNLIRTCPMPLWLVKGNDMPVEPVIIAAVDPLNEHDKPASLDDEILGLAQYVAQHVGGTVHAFHSFDPVVAVAAASANVYVPASLQCDELEVYERDRHAQRFEQVVRSHGIPGERTHLQSGLTHETLPALVAELDASLVVMGAVSRNLFKRLVIGSTAERTLERLRCDLLTVKPEAVAPMGSNYPAT